MSILISYLPALIVSFGVGWFVYLEFGLFLNLRWQHPVFRMLVVGVFTLTQGVMIYPEELTGTITTLGIYLLIVLLAYRGSLLHKLSALIMIYPACTALAYLTEDFGFLIWQYVFDKTEVMMVHTLLGISMGVLEVLLWYLIYRLTSRRLRQVTQQLTVQMWLLIDMIALVACVSVVSIIYKSEILGSYFAYPACLACILASFGCCYLYAYIAERVQAEMEIQVLKYQQNYYREMDQNQEKIRRLRHDMKNHLNVIETYLRDQEMDKAREYLTGFGEQFQGESHLFTTNSLVNAVLNTKYQAALEAGVDCTFWVELEENPRLDDIRLCSLLSNSLDNAIEAAAKIPDLGKRWLRLSVRCHNGHFSCAVENAKCNRIITQNNQIITDKEDKLAHGLGLKNIRDIVRQQDGHVDINYTDDTFTITILC